MKFARIVVLILCACFAFVTLGQQPTAGNYKTLHTFKGKDGNTPGGRLIFDASGNLYGTTLYGGAYNNNGTIFRLSPNGHGTWTESVIHSFSGSDGSIPVAGLISDAAGNFYGTTNRGGCKKAGAIFKLAPSSNGGWTETVLYSFNGDGNDGDSPQGDLVFDSKGRLYGTTVAGYPYAGGTVFQLTPNRDGTWTESVIHGFSGKDGWEPMDGLVFDAAGDLYGTTEFGGFHNRGEVFRLTPNKDGSWTETILYSFKKGADGYQPVSGLIVDSAGNLYGTTKRGGGHGDFGAVFMLKRSVSVPWTETLLHSFDNNGKDGFDPVGTLTFDQAGNLYGETCMGGANGGYGTVFKLIPGGNGKWNETVLHSFSEQSQCPASGLIFDSHGNLYGVATGNVGTFLGVVFEVGQ